MSGLMKGARSSFCHYLRCQFACQHRTFHTTQELLCCPVPGQSEVRDRRGLQTWHATTKINGSISTSAPGMGGTCSDPGLQHRRSWAPEVLYDMQSHAIMSAKWAWTTPRTQGMQVWWIGLRHVSWQHVLVARPQMSTIYINLQEKWIKMAGLHHTRLSQAGAIREFLPNLSREKPLKFLHRGLLMQLPSLQTCSASHLPLFSPKNHVNTAIATEFLHMFQSTWTISSSVLAIQFVALPAMAPHGAKTSSSIERSLSWYSLQQVLMSA